MPIDRMPLSFALALLLVGLLAGCASSPFSGHEEVAPLGPAHALESADSFGARVVWGGRIVAVDNFSDHTEIVVASFPLDRSDRPRLDRDPGVRFVLIADGFLDPMQYAPGRFISALGVVDGLIDRAIGEYLYQHPSLLAEDIHLWPADPARWQPRTSFSVGVGIRL